MPSALSPPTRSASASGPHSRKYADRDAVMFTPQAVWAHEFLKGRKDPPKAVRWWPADELCVVRRADRGQHRPVDRAATARRHGYFTTVWQREKGKWLWVYDGGDALEDADDGARPPGRSPRIVRDQGARALRSSRRRR